MNKKIIMLGMIFGSTIGGYIPTLFGADLFSLSSVFSGAFGGIIGIWIVFKMIK